MICSPTEAQPPSAIPQSPHGRRVWGLTIKGARCHGTMTEAQWEAALVGALDACAAAELRCIPSSIPSSSVSTSTTGKPLSALCALDADFGYDCGNGYVHMPLVTLLTTTYAALLANVQTLRVSHVLAADDAGLGVLLARTSSGKNLQALALQSTLLSSLRPMCDFHGLPLRRLDLQSSSRLTSLAGVETLVHLEVINAAHTSIDSLAPLTSCRALRTVNVSYCQQLASIAGLEDHALLEAVTVSHTFITSLGPLRKGCPAIRTLSLRACEHIATLDDLEGMPLLEEVDASDTLIDTLRPLRACPALKRVFLAGSDQFSTREKIRGVRIYW